jgi:hypothetical protein
MDLEWDFDHRFPFVHENRSTKKDYAGRDCCSPGVAVT